MKPLLSEEIQRAVRGRWLARGGSEKILGVSIDSRTAGAGQLFVAIVGKNHDGHNHLAAAAAAGCTLAIIGKDFDAPLSVLQRFRVGALAVNDTTTALGDLAAFYRRQLPAAVVAVTGSNGKSTVRRMIHHILSKRLTGSCGLKNHNNHIGVPLTLLAVEPKDDFVVCEMGTSSHGEIARLSQIGQPNVAVITSVSPSHLEGLGSLTHVAVEKAALLTHLAARGLAIVNADSKELDRALSNYKCNVIRFGASAGASLRLTSYTPVDTGQEFVINNRLKVTLSVCGRHNACNAMAAIAVAQRFGFGQGEAAKALADYAGMEMRLQFIDLGGHSTLINDAYNANPASMLAAADVLADSAGRRRVMIVGDMLELGGKSQALHEDVGRKLATMKIDLLIGAGNLGARMAAAAAEAGLAAEAFKSPEHLADHLDGLLHRGDTILIKGSRGSQMERLIEPITAALSAAPAAPRVRKAHPKGGAK
ncbi:MAG: UDP-N-acetylmuramoyl-tripeptide--D-alanyl-D-alanine ligase [Planctomycetaceae bacterium]|nr:UDP-N-acetylmuramoyl-tripeptide--D-alanyl-D-alanine ligase [Planctomycetaceae bacterium]